MRLLLALLHKFPNLGKFRNDSLIGLLDSHAVDMKAEYIPRREDVILQNEAPDDVYIIVSGEVELIDHSEMD
ncbi:hypothetical protein AgCh_005365 [Apium graveolens]